MARPPSSLHDFVGQRRVVNHLRRLVAGARKRGEVAASLLLLGPPGMGKTALAAAVAREYGGVTGDAPVTNFRKILAGARITRTLVDTLRELVFGDFLFVDEVHSLDREGQELLHIALDEQRTLGRDEQEKLDRSQSVSVAEFTLVGASTEPGRLTPALRSRLNVITLDPYSLRELRDIAERAARAHGLQLTPQAARHLAERSHQSPRSIEKLVRLLAQTGGGAAAIDQAMVRSFLEEIGVDDAGLDRTQQAYLEILASAGSPTSLTVLGARLGTDPAYIRGDVEPHLLHLELIEICSRGRIITGTGRQMVTTKASAAAAASAGVEQRLDAQDSPGDEEGPS